MKGVKMGINELECTNYKFLGIFDLLNYHLNPISNHNIDFQSPVDFQIPKTCQVTKISDTTPVTTSDTTEIWKYAR